MATRPDADDLAKWVSTFTTLIESVDERLPDPELLIFTRRLRHDPFAQQNWYRLRDAVVPRLPASRGGEHKAWDDIANIALDGDHMAKGLAAIRQAHAPYCGDAREPLTRTGDRWRCSYGTDCNGPHWDFDGTELDNPGPTPAGPAGR